MKLWIGGIVDAIIADDFRHIRNSLEEKVNTYIENVNYGDGISTWDIIIVISSAPPLEYVRFHKKSKETDIRKVLNFDSFLDSNFIERNHFIKDALLDSLDDLKNKGILNFDFIKLKEDFIDALS